MTEKTLEKCLADCPHETTLFVVKILGGRRAKERLGAMGILPGTEIIKKRSGMRRGPILAKVRGTSLVLGRGISEKIIVNCDKNAVY